MARRSVALLFSAVFGLTGCFGKAGEAPKRDGGPEIDAGVSDPVDAGALQPLEVSFPLDEGLGLSEVGAHALRVVTPQVLELFRVTSKPADPARVKDWDWVDESTGALNANAPLPADFEVHVQEQILPVQKVGFRRRVRYAPLVMRDLRIGNWLTLVLASPLPEGARVEVRAPNKLLWPATMKFEARVDPARLSPALHVNQLGYGRTLAKRARVGYFLGSLGELELTESSFWVVDARTGAEVFSGALVRRPDQGFGGSPLPYQQVLEADFSLLETPGEYRLRVEHLGESYPFSIDDGIAGGFARTYALGLLHQRCGAELGLPFTRFSHGADHTAPAELPAPSSSTWSVIAGESSNYSAHQAPGTPQLKDPASMLYPFVRSGKLDVRFGHHDAGDYSKYTTNSAALVHALVFAADALAGVAALDNLGLPESGDGKSDLLQLARWEAEFLSRMQDDDGGFFFLVYPRDRRYEQNVTPDNGDGQLVWPKTTAATAAATAALAQIASSPTFKAQFPTEAQAYLEQAKKGFGFLTAAIALHGKDGAYQKITHYGNEFRHDDELAWAATELYLATGEAAYHQQLLAWLPDPTATSVKRWSWWRLFDAYGNALRSYAFAQRSGRLDGSKLDASYLAKCQAEVIAAGADQLDRAKASAYGTSFPLESKAYGAAGWYFSSEQAFDLAVAHQLDPRPELLSAIVSNLDYEAGANPVNVSFISGLGWKQQREVVHQWAQNDLRVLPPSGIPQGNLQTGFTVFGSYGAELGKLSFPLDNAASAAYPMYDRWGDAFNVTTEMVAPQIARALATAAALMAMTPLKDQPWKSAAAEIIGLAPEAVLGTELEARIQASGLDLTRARVTWDGEGIEPGYGHSFRFKPTVWGPQALEAESYLPDGRRVFAVWQLAATSPAQAGLPTVTLVADVPNASEAGPSHGRATLTRTGDLASPLQVRFSIGGSATHNWDYNAIGGNYWNYRLNTVELPAGTASVSLPVQVFQDSYVEPTEKVVFTLLLDAAYHVGAAGRAEVSIADDD